MVFDVLASLFGFLQSRGCHMEFRWLLRDLRRQDVRGLWEMKGTMAPGWWWEKWKRGRVREKVPEQRQGSSYAHLSWLGLL
jgi:hypothetical protein